MFQALDADEPEQSIDLVKSAFTQTALECLVVVQYILDGNRYTLFSQFIKEAHMFHKISLLNLNPENLTLRR
jgi:hypothetical protein